MINTKEGGRNTICKNLKIVCRVPISTQIWPYEWKINFKLQAMICTPLQVNTNRITEEILVKCSDFWALDCHSAGERVREGCALVVQAQSNSRAKSMLSRETLEDMAWRRVSKRFRSDMASSGAFFDPFHHVIHLTLHYPPRRHPSD